MHIFVIIAALILISAPGFAAPPLPDKKDVNAGLELRIENLETDLSALKKQSVKLSRSIRQNEKEKVRLKTKIIELEAESTLLEEKLFEDQKALSELIMGLQRMRRTPPEALLIRPGDPLDSARAAMLMSRVVPQYQEQAQALNDDLALLAELHESLERENKAALSMEKTLQSELAQLDIALEKRQNLYRQTRNDIAQKEKASKAIARQAKTTGDLVKKLSQRPKRSAGLSSIMPHRALGLPVTGNIQVGFNRDNAIGAKSQGIEIAAAPRAIVISPMDGTVRFSGEFRQYGQVIIVEHDKGYHSLIAGLEKIDTVVGQSVLAGEPVGRMSKKKQGQNPILYYELRHKGKAINPSRKLKIAKL